MDISKKITKIIEELLLNRALQNRADAMPIIAIYLFGSFAEGRERQRSDIDLAFVFSEKFYKKDPFRSLQEAELLSMEISKKIGKPVDVVILNSTSLSFAFHTLKKTVCLYEKSSVDRILYEITVQNKYEDFMPFIKDLRDSKRERLLGRN